MVKGARRTRYLPSTVRIREHEVQTKTPHDRRICSRTSFDPLADLRHPQFQRTDLAAKRMLFPGLPPSGQMQFGVFHETPKKCSKYPSIGHFVTVSSGRPKRT